MTSSASLTAHRFFILLERSITPFKKSIPRFSLIGSEESTSQRWRPLQTSPYRQSLKNIIKYKKYHKISPLRTDSLLEYQSYQYIKDFFLVHIFTWRKEKGN